MGLYLSKQQIIGNNFTNTYNNNTIMDNKIMDTIMQVLTKIVKSKIKINS